MAILSGCTHQGFLVPTIFREVKVPMPKKGPEDEQKYEPMMMTVQAFCIKCSSNIKFETPDEAKR